MDDGEKTGVFRKVDLELTLGTIIGTISQMTLSKGTWYCRILGMWPSEPKARLFPGAGGSPQEPPKRPHFSPPKHTQIMTHPIHHITCLHNRNLVNMKQTTVVLAFLLLALPGVRAQSPRAITLDEAVKLGIDNSKQLRQSKNKIDEALARLDQAKDLRLPSAKVSFQYLHALMIARTIMIPGLTQKPLDLPFDFPAYLGTLGITEPIINGNQFKYARQSADLLLQLSKLDADKDREDVTYLIISAYINYNKVLQNQTIVAKNMQDVDQKLSEITKYEGQGLATRNDELRFQLQKSQIQLTEIELENNRKDRQL